MKYQDTWRNGCVVEEGNRECADRYETIKKFCQENFNYRFTVCDIGANMGYFSIRLIEDFNCNVMAWEFHQYEQRKKIIAKNKLDKKLMYINRKLSLEDVNIMRSICKFDLVLALSVLHHVTEPIGQWIDTLRGMSKHTIIELAGDDSELTKKREEYKAHEDGRIIGWGDSHLQEGFKRPIIYYGGL